MSNALDDLERLVNRLRTECPWDREQTFQTLRTYLFEECHEVLDALDHDNATALRSELGDLLFQIFFLARLASEAGWFSLDDVARQIERKMILRHPHVFGPQKANDAEEVRAGWEKRKRGETGAPDDPLGGIPKTLPSLPAAFRIGTRAADLGFDWERETDLLSKIEEEIGEIRQARDSRKATEEELGDLLFALANWARHRKLDPERSLRLANEKFRRRFRRVAEKARASGRDVAACSAAQLDAYWNEVKREETQVTATPATPTPGQV